MAVNEFVCNDKEIGVWGSCRGKKFVMFEGAVHMGAVYVGLKKAVN